MFGLLLLLILAYIGFTVADRLVLRNDHWDMDSRRA